MTAMKEKMKAGAAKVTEAAKNPQVRSTARDVAVVAGGTLVALSLLEAARQVKALVA